MIVHKSQKGFTLIEIMVVMTIFAILVALSMVAFQGATRKARDTKRKSDLKQVQAALEKYFQNTGRYPKQNVLSVLAKMSILCEDNSVIQWGQTWSCDDLSYPGSITYMSLVPKEPKPWVIATQEYNYFYFAYETNGTWSPTVGTPKYGSYRLVACLENSNDPERDSTFSFPVFSCPADRVPYVLSPP